MNEPSLAQQVTELIGEALQIDVPGPDVDLVDAGLIDSLALVTLITEIERAFAIRISMDDFDLARFRTAEQMAGVVAAHASEARSA